MAVNESYLNGASDWYADWVRAAHGRGNVPCRIPPGKVYSLGMDQSGELGERQADGTYVLAPLSVRVLDNADRATANALLQFETQDEQFTDDFLPSIAHLPATVVEATAPIVGKALPWWAWLAAGVVGYGALVQAGILPPLNKLVKS